MLLRSQTGRAEGPYAHVAPEPLTTQIDSTIFTDADGRTLYIWQDGRSALLDPKTGTLTTEPRRLDQTVWRPEPYLEGPFMFEHDGRYFLTLAAWSYRNPETGTLTHHPTPNERPRLSKWSYDCVIAAAARPEGPYGTRRCCLVGGGHNNFFADHAGRWWCTMFGNPRGDLPDKPFACRPAILPLEWRDGWPVPILT